MSMVRRIMKMTGKPRTTVVNVLQGGPCADRYSVETQQVVLAAAVELQAKARCAARKRRETLRRKKVTVLVLCSCGEETCVNVSVTHACDRCGASVNVLRWCSSCGQLMCADCVSGWETRPDLGRIHALVCHDCATTSRRSAAHGDGGYSQRISLPTAATCEQAQRGNRS